MPVVSQEIPSLVNGISQQTSTQRLPSQAEDQVNIESSVVDGLRRRPPLEFIATLDGSNVYPNKSKFWSIQRDESNQFVVVFYDNGVKVFDLAGNEKTVTFPDGNTYLDSTNPKDDIRCVNIADYTFVANKSVTPAADSSSSAAKVEEFLIYCKNSGFGREYKVSLTHPDMQTALGYGISVIFQMPTGSNAATDAPFSDTNKIVDILLKGTSSDHWDATANGIGFKTVRDDTGASLSTTQGLSNYSGITSYFTWEAYNSTIYGKPTDGDADYTVTTSDGQGNASMYVIRDEIQKFSDLPYYAKLNMIVKITGDEGEILTDYYVKYTGDGVWQETLGPGVPLGFNDATMPHALINNNDGTFTFAKQTWTDRTCGDATSNPNPTFVGTTIQNLTFYKNRLGILSGENLILSGNADYYNFFAQTVTDSLDTDPIDIAASGTEVNTLKNSVGFNETLLLFSDTTQYKLDHAGDTVSPTTAILNQVSSFEHNDSVTPVAAGKFAYFAQSRNDVTLIREYFSSDDTLTNDGVDITAHVSTLIPTNAYQLLSNSTEDVLIALCADTADSQVAPYSAGGSDITVTNAGTMYVYKYYFNGDTRVQSGWSKWEFAGVKILGAMTTDSFIYVFAAEGQTTKLFKLDLRNADDSGIGFNIALDLKKSVTGSYSSGTGLTTFTSPYGGKVNLQSVDSTNGTSYTLTNQAASTCTITVTDYANIAAGTTLTLTKDDGTTVTFTSIAVGTAGTNEFKTETNNNTTADNIYTAINAHADFSAPNPAANVVTVTRAAIGDKNPTVTSSDTTRLAVTNFVPGGAVYQLDGDHTGLIVGTPYTSTYHMSTPYIREKTDRGVVAITSGRFQIRTISFNYENTGFIEIQVTPANRDTHKSFVTPYVLGFVGKVDLPEIGDGTVRVPIQCKNTDVTLKLVSNSYLPMNVTGAELEGYYHSRATRV